MPGSKNQTARYYVIDECLRSKGKRYWSKQELIDAVNEKLDIVIMERSLDYDIQYMRQNEQLRYEAPIKYSKKHNGYYYTDPEYSIRNLPLNEEDIKALEFATTILSQYKDVSILNDFTGVVDKVVNVVNHVKKKNYGLTFPFIEFEKAPYYKGSDFLDMLIDAIHNKTAIEVSYKKFRDADSKTHLIHPYLLKEYRNRWYLLGLHQKRNKIITLGLDRIINIIESEEVYIPSVDFNPEAYFKNTVGITYDDSLVEEVILSFTPLQGEYLKTQYLHESQEIIQEDDIECVIKLKVTPNYELKEKILGYGSDVKVLEPESLRNEIAQKIASSYKNYF